MADNDIKIYTKGADISSANLSTVFEAINLHRGNGNLEKAKLLGQRLSTITPESEKNGLSIDFKNILPQRFLSQDIMYQIKVLLIFAAESLLQVEIPVPQLATTAINAAQSTMVAMFSEIQESMEVLSYSIDWLLCNPDGFGQCIGFPVWLKQSIQDEYQNSNGGDQPGDISLACECGAKLINHQRNGVSEDALISDCKPRPFRGVHFALDGADGGKAWRA